MRNFQRDLADEKRGKMAGVVAVAVAAIRDRAGVLRLPCILHAFRVLFSGAKHSDSQRRFVAQILVEHRS
jgi:hypothetical protein